MGVDFDHECNVKYATNSVIWRSTAFIISIATTAAQTLPPRCDFLLRMMNKGYKVMTSLAVLVFLVVLDLVVIICRKLGLLLFTILTLRKLVMELSLLVDRIMLSLGLLVAQLMFMVHMLDHP